MFTEPSYYNIRDPAGYRFSVEEEGELPFDSRLRIHAKGHPHHKEPRPQYAARSEEMVALKQQQKAKFADFLDFIEHYQRYFIRQVKAGLFRKYPKDPFLVAYGDDIARSTFIRYFEQVAHKPDEYHIELFEPVLEFMDTIVDEILELPLADRYNDPEVERHHLKYITGEEWKANQAEKGAWGEPINVKMAAKGKLMKMLAKKKKIYRLASTGQEITQANADFIVGTLKLALDDPEVIDKLKPTEEEEAFLRTIAEHEGGKRKTKKMKKV